MRFDFLESGATECPMLRIYGASPEDHLELLNQIQLLVSGEEFRICMNDMRGFVAQSDIVVWMSSIENAHHKIGIFMTGKVLEWRLTRSLWNTVSGLIEPFSTTLQHTSHQWLSGPESRYVLQDANISVLLTNSDKGSW